MHTHTHTHTQRAHTHTRTHAHAAEGKDLRVTEANKRQYVDLIARHRMTTSIKQQITAFLEGFWQLVPKWVAARVLHI